MDYLSFSNTRTDENGKIYINTFSGEQFVGYSQQAYNDLNNMLEEAIKKAEEYKTKSEEYKKMLKEHGLIEEEPTQEEINTQLLSTINALSKQVKELSVELKDIKKGGINHEYNSKSGNNNKKSKNLELCERSVEHSEVNALNS